VRRYLKAARTAGFHVEAGEGGLTDALIGAICETVRPTPPDGHGASWATLARRRAQLRAWLDADIRLLPTAPSLISLPPR
jgi:hypothetical protein